MLSRSAEPAPPSDDKRWRIVATTMRRHGYSQYALIETLHSIQQSMGFLDEAGLRYVAQGLSVPLSKVYGVATFYHSFTLKPQGKHSCVVCMGTACYIKGAGKLLDAVEESAHIRPGETTEDGQVSLLTARCLGSCGLAPVVVMDGQVSGHVDEQRISESIETWKAEKEAVLA